MFLFAVDVARRLPLFASIVEFDVVGGEHPSLAGSLHSARHPPLVDRDTVDKEVAVEETHFVHILSSVVVHGAVVLGWRHSLSQRRVGADYLRLSWPTYLA